MTRRALFVALALLLPAAVSGQHAPRAVRAMGVDEGPVMAVIRRVAARLRTTRYVHSTHIVESEGRFDWDCSGMAAWVLARATPRAHATVMAHNGRGRPVASDYHDVIAAAPIDRARDGWVRLRNASELRPGDVIAWRRPPTVASRNTGHVAFVAEAPRRLDREGRRWSVRIVDSTSIPHGDDTRPRAHRSGFGYGTIVVHYDDPRGEATGYGWYGLPTRLDFRTHLALGRAVR